MGKTAVRSAVVVCWTTCFSSSFQLLLIFCELTSVQSVQSRLGTSLTGHPQQIPATVTFLPRPQSRRQFHHLLGKRMMCSPSLRSMWEAPSSQPAIGMGLLCVGTRQAILEPDDLGRRPPLTSTRRQPSSNQMEVEDLCMKGLAMNTNTRLLAICFGIWPIWPLIALHLLLPCFTCGFLMFLRNVEIFQYKTWLVGRIYHFLLRSNCDWFHLQPLQVNIIFINL